MRARRDPGTAPVCETCLIARPGTDLRGVVATCSYEARHYGVHSAMPISEAARRLPPETVYVRPSMDRDARVSRQIMEVWRPSLPW
jgi:DNA polymerase-4